MAIQCFEKEELKYLSTITDIPLVITTYFYDMRFPYHCYLIQVFLFSAEQALLLFNEESLTEIKTFASSTVVKSFVFFDSDS